MDGNAPADTVTLNMVSLLQVEGYTSVVISCMDSKKGARTLSRRVRTRQRYGKDIGILLHLSCLLSSAGSWPFDHGTTLHNSDPLALEGKSPG